MRPSPTGNTNLQALILISLSVLLNSTYPVLIPILHLSQNPLLYVFFWKTGTLTGTLAIAFTVYRHHALYRPLWSAWLHAIRKPGFALMCLGHTDILLLTLAAHHIPISIGVIILQISPILFIWTMWLTHRQTATYMCPDRTTLALSLTALAGVALAVYSERSTLSTTLDTGLMLGAVVCLAAALLGAMNALSIRVGRDVHAATPTSPIILATIIGYPITIAATLPFLLTLGLTTGNPTVPQTALLIAALGTAIPSSSGILWRIANLRTPNLSVNAVQNLLPIFALSGLFLTGNADVHHPSLLIAGAGIVISVNLTLLFRQNKPPSSRP